ncbi:MAG: hypothetical protein ACUVRS_08925 [Armatimonadota bacterium]
MRKVRFILLLFALLFATGSLVSAAGEKVANPQWWGKAPGEKPFVQGKVANVSPTNIAVQTPEGIKPFVVNERTRVMVRGQKATIADVKVGDPVIVRFQLVPNNVPIALGIVVPKPMVSGQIVAIQGNVIIVREAVKQIRPKVRPAATATPTSKREAHKLGLPAPQVPVERPQPGGPERRITVTDATKYTSRGYQGTLADLRVGYFVRAAGSFNADNLIADHIEFVPAVAKGTVTAVENGVIVVKTVRQLTLQLQPSDATVVWVKPRIAPNKRGSLEDVKVGSPVDVGFHPTESGPAPLLWIAVYTGM